MNTYKHGDRVKIVQYPTAPKESEVGRIGSFIRYSKPHGFAVVMLDPERKSEIDKEWQIHPENLQLEHRVICIVEDCTFYANDGSETCPSHY